MDIAGQRIGIGAAQFGELAKAGKVKVIGVPVQNDLVFLDMNVKIPPFDNPKARLALALMVDQKEYMTRTPSGRKKPTATARTAGSGSSGFSRPR